MDSKITTTLTNQGTLTDVSYISVSCTHALIDIDSRNGR